MGTNIVVDTNSGEHLSQTPIASTGVDSRTMAFLAANACEAKLAKSTIVLDVGSVTVLAEYFVIAGGDSQAQVNAIADAVADALMAHGLKPRSIEGKSEGRWVLIDFGSVIVHVLQEKERNYYKIEQFWNHALIVDRQEWVQDPQQDRFG